MNEKLTRKSYRTRPIYGGETELSFTSDEVEAFWSRIASHEYESANKELESTHIQRFEVSVPLLRLPPNGTLLNLWSRQGEGIPYIRARFPDIDLVNLEISHVMLEQARSGFSDETFDYCDLQSLDLPDGHFDAILSLETLEHSPSPQKLLKEMYRVLKPDGQLVLTCPSALSEFHLWFADRFMDNHGEGPHRFPSTLHVKKMLMRAGLRLVLHRATLFVPFELGAIFHKFNGLCERLCQWFPACELGIRQLYEAEKP